MRWLFEKLKESAEIVVYSYSRETDELDGIIEYNKQLGMANIVKPCALDENDEWASGKTVSKFVRRVVDEGLPQFRRIVTG